MARVTRIFSVVLVLCAVACGGASKPAPSSSANNCTGRVLALGESCETR